MTVTSTDLWRMGAAELAEAIRSKQASSQEVIEAHLRRVEAVNPAVNAVTVVLGERALDAARAADRMGAAGGELPPLHGVPFTVKENIDLAASAARHPARPAIRFLGGTLIYRALDEAAGRFAGALRGLGVREGDRVALLLPNCPQFVIAFYGALRAGAVVAPPSPLDAAAELRQGWGDAGVRAAVCLATFYPEVAAVRPDLPTLERVVVTGITDDAPALSRLLFPLTREGRAARPPAIPEDAHTHRFRALLASATPDGPAPARAATAVGAR